MYAMVLLVTKWSKTNNILVQLSSPGWNFSRHVVRISVSVSGFYEGVKHRNWLHNRNVDEHITS